MSTTPVVLIRRPPMEEGPCEWGCHEYDADVLVSVCENDGPLYKLSRDLYITWKQHITQLALTHLGHYDPSWDSLAWCLEHAGPLLQATQLEAKHMHPEDNFTGSGSV